MGEMDEASILCSLQGTRTICGEGACPQTSPQPTGPARRAQKKKKTVFSSKKKRKNKKIHLHFP
jgi:hypothetical protein